MDILNFIDSLGGKVTELATLLRGQQKENIELLTKNTELESMLSVQMNECALAHITIFLMFMFTIF